MQLTKAPFTLYRINFHTGLIFTPIEKFVGVYTTPLHSVVRSYSRYRNRRKLLECTEIYSKQQYFHDIITKIVIELYVDNV